MNESERQRKGWHTDEGTGATPAEALHTILEFTVEYKAIFREWLNRQLAMHESSLVLSAEDIDEALSNIDDILHIAMDRPRKKAVVIQGQEDLRGILERLLEEARGAIDEVNKADEDPDRGTGMYL